MTTVYRPSGVGTHLDPSRAYLLCRVRRGKKSTPYGHPKQAQRQKPSADHADLPRHPLPFPPALFSDPRPRPAPHTTRPDPKMRAYAPRSRAGSSACGVRFEVGIARTGGQEKARSGLEAGLQDSPPPHLLKGLELTDRAFPCSSANAEFDEFQDGLRITRKSQFHYRHGGTKPGRVGTWSALPIHMKARGFHSSVSGPGVSEGSALVTPKGFLQFGHVFYWWV